MSGPQEERGPVRVLVAEDQQAVRAGLVLILRSAGDIEVVGEAPDGEEAVRLARELRPDLVLMDVQMPRLDGVSATRQVVAEGLADVLVLTTFDLDEYVHAAIRAGASGFMLKNASPDQLCDAIRVVAAGEAMLAPAVTRRLIRAFAAIPPALLARPPLPGGRGALGNLTRRELDVLILVARGLSNAQIARSLNLSEAGRKVHDEIAPLALGIEADLLHGLTAEQIETLNTVIERLLIRARLISAP